MQVQGERPLFQRTRDGLLDAPQPSPSNRSCLALVHPGLLIFRHLVRESWGRITAETMKVVLADHEGDPGGICRHGESGSHSVTGYIAEPAAGLFHVRRGHGCTGTWTAYEV